MSFLITDWLLTVAPVIKFKELKFNDQEVLQEYLNENKSYPENEIIGTSTFILHNKIMNIVTNKHVLDAVDNNIVLGLRLESSIYLYQISNILIQLDTS